MAGFTLESLEFRKEREAGWRELEQLVAKAESRGLAGLDADELYRLPVLYRGALSSLSVARSISLDRNLLDYLEVLAARAYVYVYGVKQDYLEEISRFFRRGFPRLVWEMRGALAIAVAILAAGILCGWVLTAKNPDLFFSFVPDAYSQGRSPLSTRDELLEVLRGGGERSGLSIFASALFTNNAQVGFLCFALGFAAGVPVALLLFYNGILLGAFAAIHQRVDLTLEFWAWILPHGVTELLAVCLCGAAGLTLGHSLAFPGRYTRVENLAIAGRRAAAVVLGSVALFFVAGLIEGYFRQLVTWDAPRLALAVLTAAAWTWYFARPGRRAT
jgi:uncharacterized membrane protein SpoIIM required for sporulation